MIPILKYFDIKIFRSDYQISENKAVSDSKKKNDLTIANQMQNGVNSNSREREKRIILKMNFQGRVIVPLFLMFLEEAKPILAGAEMQTTG